VWLHAPHWLHRPTWLIGNPPFWHAQFTHLGDWQSVRVLGSWEASRDCESPNMHSRFQDLLLPLENLEPKLSSDASGAVRLTTLF
jgi:hypothetical protein